MLEAVTLHSVHSVFGCDHCQLRPADLVIRRLPGRMLVYRALANRRMTLSCGSGCPLEAIA